jgi:hypothetical protein
VFDGTNVGIGTTSPGAKLDVNGTTYLRSKVSFGSTSVQNIDADATTLYLRGTSTAFQDAAASSTYAQIASDGYYYSLGGPMMNRNSAATSGYVYNIIRTPDGNAGILLGSPAPYSDSSNIYRNFAHIFVDGSGGNQSLLLQEGRAYIGTGASYGGILNIGSYADGGFYGIAMRTTGATAGPIAFQNRYGTVVGTITSTDSGTAFNTSSDYRLKENVTPLTTGLATINALKPVNYVWKIDAFAGEGFIAHELAEVVPLAVTGVKDALNNDGSIRPQSVDYSKLVVHLVAAVQELSAKNDALEARLAKLETK